MRIAPARSSAPRSGTTPSRALLALVAAVGLVAAEALRMSGPLLDLVVARAGVYAAAITAVAVFAVPAALGALVAAVGARYATGLTVFALVVLRFLAQASPTFGIGAATVVVALGALILVVRQVAGVTGGPVLAVTGLVLGGAIDVALRTVLFTWDPVWRPGIVPWLVVLAECAALVLAYSAVRRGLRGDPYPVRRVGLLGGYLALSVLITGSPGFLASASGLDLPYAAAALLVGALFTVEVLSRSGLPGGSGRWSAPPGSDGSGSRYGSGTVAAVLLAGGVTVAILVTGVIVVLGVVAAQVGAALLLARALTPVRADTVPDEEDPEERRAAEKLNQPASADDEVAVRSLKVRPRRRSAFGFGVAGLATGMFYVLVVLLYQIHYELPLPFPNQVMPIAAAVLLGVLAWGARLGAAASGGSAGDSAAAGGDSAAAGGDSAAAGGDSAGAGGGPAGGGTVVSAVPAGDSAAADERAAKRGRLAPLAMLPAVLLLAPVLMLVTAPAPQAAPEQPVDSFRMLSWNVHYARNSDGIIDPEALAVAIEKQHADVVMLQEVSRGWPIGGTLDGAEWLSRRLAMPYVYAPAADEQFGNLILSRLRITAADTGELPQGAGTMRRSYAAATVELPHGRTVALYDLHLQHHDENTPTRLAEIDVLLDAWDSETPAVISGDFNSAPGSKEIAKIKEAGLVSAQDTTGHSGLRTSPTPRPQHRIDWIFGTSDVAFSNFARPKVTTSDHYPLAVTVRVG